MVTIITAGIVYYLWNNETKPPQTQEEAVRQAQEYKPKTGCTQALVPAIHEVTGARYTFPSGCLAPGWKPDRLK